MSKTYRVTVSGAEPETAACAGLRQFASWRASPSVQPSARLVEERKDGGLVLDVTIHEGRNRQVRRMCAAVGLEVRRLVRVSEGELSLGSLPPGRWRRLTPEETAYIRSLI